MGTGRNACRYRGLNGVLKKNARGVQCSARYPDEHSGVVATAPGWSAIVSYTPRLQEILRARMPVGTFGAERSRNLARPDYRR